MTDLMTVPPRWVTLRGEVVDGDRGLRVVTLLDEAVALQAPFEGFGLQVGIGAALHDVDSSGQPTSAEKAAVRGFEEGLVQALGDQGRLVAVTTLDGQREYLAYVRSVDVLLPWRDTPPAGTEDRDWGVRVLIDPTWLGLREMAGLLRPGEDALPPLQEVAPPDADEPPLPEHEQPPA